MMMMMDQVLLCTFLLPLKSLTQLSLSVSRVDEGIFDELIFCISGGNADQATEWNLRKCSAAALDVLSSVFRETILTHPIANLT